MKATDLREKSQDDLRELEKSLARDVFQNRLKNFTNRLDDTSAMRKAKRDLARVKTLLREAALGLVRTGGGAKPAAAKPAKDDSPAQAAAPAKKAAKKAAPKAEAKAAAPAAEAKPKKAATKSKKTESEAK